MNHFTHNHTHFHRRLLTRFLRITHQTKPSLTGLSSIRTLINLRQVKSNSHLRHRRHNLRHDHRLALLSPTRVAPFKAKTRIININTHRHNRITSPAHFHHRHNNPILHNLRHIHINIKYSLSRSIKNRPLLRHSMTILLQLMTNLRHHIIKVNHQLRPYNIRFSMLRLSLLIQARTITITHRPNTSNLIQELLTQQQRQQSPRRTRIPRLTVRNRRTISNHLQRRTTINSLAQRRQTHRFTPRPSFRNHKARIINNRPRLMLNQVRSTIILRHKSLHSLLTRRHITSQSTNTNTMLGRRLLISRTLRRLTTHSKHLSRTNIMTITRSTTRLTHMLRPTLTRILKLSLNITSLNSVNQGAHKRMILSTRRRSQSPSSHSNSSHSPTLRIITRHLRRKKSPYI